MKALTCCAIIAIAISSPCPALADAAGEECEMIGATLLADGNTDIIACLADVPGGTTGHYVSQVYTTPECKRAYSEVRVRKSYNGANLVYDKKAFYTVNTGAVSQIAINVNNAGYGAHYYQPPTNPGSGWYAVAAQCDSGWVKTACEVFAGSNYVLAGESIASDTICGGGNPALGDGFTWMQAGITCCKVQ